MGTMTPRVFNIIVLYALRILFIVIIVGVCPQSFEDQIFITLMKASQNYTNLHLAQLFSRSSDTISSTVTTFTHVLHYILFRDIMTTMPTRFKNDTCSIFIFTVYFL